MKSKILLEIQEIDLEERGDLNEVFINKRSMLQEEFRRKSHQEEIEWKQRACTKWLEGDHNTKFFMA